MSTKSNYRKYYFFKTIYKIKSYYSDFISLFMIQVKFSFQGKRFTKTKKIQFCKNHEKNLDILYGIAKESIERERKSSLEQLMMICCFHISKEIRKKTVERIIHHKLLRELSKNHNTLNILKDIKEMSIEARIDNIPKKIYNFHPNMDIYV